MVNTLFDAMRSEMNDVLLKAEALLCLGFGFNDDHLQGVIKRRLAAGMPVIIVTRDASTGVGGHIFIEPTVQNVAGALFAETSISTGFTKSPLTVYGLIASRELALERVGGTSSTAAETIIFDGRAVANPPPGMQDIGKSLPTTKDAF